MSGSKTGHRAVVIGGGIAGLATAALLGREGYEVTLLEARHELGGRAGSWQQAGFRFDTGPSWFLMPEVFEHFYRLLGTSTTRQLSLSRLDPGYRVFFQDHAEPIDIGSGRAKNIAVFEGIEPGAGRALARYLDSAKETYQLALERFLYSTFASYRSLLSPALLPRLGRLLRLLLQPLDRFGAGYVSDLRLQQILGYPAVFLGSAPSMTPSLYHMMSHLDLDDGVYYPSGGFTTLIDSISALARAEGVNIVTGARASRITSVAAGSRTRVTGVRYTNDAGTISQADADADVVVSAADLHHTETELLPPPLRTYPQRWWNDRIPGPGAVLVCLGVRGSLPQISHHSLFFTSDWDTNFDSIFTAPTSIPDPASVYLCRPSATDATVAPPGHENLFILVPVPADSGIGAGGVDGSGDLQVEAVADRVVNQIGSWAGIDDLPSRIVVRRTVGPEDFARDFQSWQGSALGPGHTLRQSAFLRGKNVSSKVDGLLYAGATTVPGIGLPMCLISAELVIKRLRHDTSATKLPEPL